VSVRLPNVVTSVALALAIGLVGIPASPVAVGSAAAGARSQGALNAPLKIVIVSPAAEIYSSARTLLVKFSCTSPSGIKRCTAAIGRAGADARNVLSGRRLRLTRTGPYVVRVRATDLRGRSASKTLRFHVERTVSWSGYTWSVRSRGSGGPGPNNWSDSQANVRVSGSDLLLSVAKDPSGHWASAEVENQRNLGYGTYRWVVASDLSGLDAYQVLGMFTYGGWGPWITEIDLEPSHWGNLSWSNGSAAVWQNASTRANEAHTFDYSNRPPYVNQFVWSPGRVDFLVTDATGAVLLNWTVTTGVPRPSSEVPIINFWRFHNVPPTGVTTVRISSFAWTPLGQ
jgi:hypothetical protein